MVGIITLSFKSDLTNFTIYSKNNQKTFSEEDTDTKMYITSKIKTLAKRLTQISEEMGGNQLSVAEKAKIYTEITACSKMVEDVQKKYPEAITLLETFEEFKKVHDSSSTCIPSRPITNPSSSSTSSPISSHSETETRQVFNSSKVNQMTESELKELCISACKQLIEVMTVQCDQIKSAAIIKKNLSDVLRNMNSLSPDYELARAVLKAKTHYALHLPLSNLLKILEIENKINSSGKCSSDKKKAQPVALKLLRIVASPINDEASISTSYQVLTENMNKQLDMILEILSDPDAKRASLLVDNILQAEEEDFRDPHRFDILLNPLYRGKIDRKKATVILMDNDLLIRKSDFVSNSFVVAFLNKSRKLEEKIFTFDSQTNQYTNGNTSIFQYIKIKQGEFKKDRKAIEVPDPKSVYAHMHAWARARKERAVESVHQFYLKKIEEMSSLEKFDEFSVDKYDILTPSEQLSLFIWSTSEYRDMNSVVSGESPVTDTEGVNTALINQVAIGALAKLPPTQHFGLTRYDKSTKAQLKELYKLYTEGKAHTLDRFMSTSWSDMSTRVDGYRYNTLIRVISKTGRNITKYSTFSSKESEILFPPGTKFKVTRMRPPIGEDDSDEQIYEVTLEEI